MKSLILLLQLSVSVNCFSQSQRQFEVIRTKLNLELINKKITNKDSSILLDKNSKLVSNYLGNIITSNKIKYHVIKTYYVYNMKVSPTIESKILLYNIKNKIIGYYPVPTRNYLPESIIHNCMVFNLVEKDCDKKVRISFKGGIPKAINLGCIANNYIEFIPQK
ncbi:hypothetical protein HHL16_23600 [Pseudoflavitalea sp. G-6-1-2]|uniref:hypothetical protein n=1 Tax=Pseudoflavitalea sp. G-6-1-2 TaxID=2728841 RepID=UPI00146C5FEB|nr:hypothetical protein [Pseudoflavitalea sp. G-6-1-2]NML23886.1 hypothetical protein [Pseudoflavitalea sp. G-6-1-2]